MATPAAAMRQRFGTFPCIGCSSLGPRTAPPSARPVTRRGGGSCALPGHLRHHEVVDGGASRLTREAQGQARARRPLGGREELSGPALLQAGGERAEAALVDL